MSVTALGPEIARIHRAEWGRLLSLLIARSRRLDLAEEALGEAFARAVERWPADGLPANPAGWLYTTAWRWLVGRTRAEAVAGRAAHLLVVRPDRGADVAEPGAIPGELGDDRLRLIVLCCHPALAPDSRAALALRLVIGTPTDEIARLFLVPVPTMAARITRAKRKIVAAGIPLASPEGQELRVRLDEVCRTIYLAFTAGYAPGDGADLLRIDLAGEAVELAALLRHLVPDSAQVTALLALVLLQHSRRDARIEDGRLVTLDDQDRSRWHRPEIDAAVGLLDGLAPGTGFAEELRLQAAIAREHAVAPSASLTPWARIAEHYAALEVLTRSPVVRMNRAVAVGMADGAAAGLELLAGLDALLPDSHRLAAVRADLARQAGDVALARASYAQAIERCGNAVERAHLAGRLRQLDGEPS